MPGTELNSRRRLGLLSLLLAALCFMALLRPALAADSAGIILALTGKVDLLRGAEIRAATSRAELHSGDTIVTSDGQVQIRFIDGTMLTLYRDTRFAVDDYRYGKGQTERAHFSLLDGLMHTLTGQIDKQNYLLKTRLANLGVRGTEYSVQLADTLHVSVDQGRVVIANGGGSLEVGAGRNAIVTGQNAMPLPSSTKIDLRPQGAARPGAGAPPPPFAGGQTLGHGGLAPGGAAPPPPPPGTQNMNSRQQQAPAGGGAPGGGAPGGGAPGGGAPGGGAPGGGAPGGGAPGH